MADGLRQDLPVSYIYTLSDPRDGSVRYVGKSVDPAKRFRDHLCFSKTEGTHKANWIKQLGALDLKPVQDIVATATLAEIDDLERDWIARFHDAGAYLTNGTDGGDHGGHPHTKETREKMRKPKSAAHAAAISRAKTGSGHHRAKLVEAQVAEIKSLLRLGELRHREIAEQYNVSRTAISLISNGTNWSHVDG